MDYCMHVMDYYIYGDAPASRVRDYALACGYLERRHAITDYSHSRFPAFDAVEDIKDWLGMETWNAISPKMSQITDPTEFAAIADSAGVCGFPVQAWYELYHGQGSWK